MEKLLIKKSEFTSKPVGITKYIYLFICCFSSSLYVDFDRFSVCVRLTQMEKLL